MVSPVLPKSDYGGQGEYQQNNTMNTQSTTKKIQAWLLRGHKITSLQALEKWGCMRLSARILDLRRAGMDIRTTPITRNGKTFAQYHLA